MTSETKRAARIAEMYKRGLETAWEFYDAKRHLVSRPGIKPGTRTSWLSASLPFAHALLRQGHAESVSEAAAIVAAVLDRQELADQHPHRGNWPWLADDAEVVDLNAVQFVLIRLLPLLMQHDEQLPRELLARCRESVRLALMEEERLDVAPTYTNIHLMSLFALLIGGQWLGDKHFLELGKARWARWVRFTLQSGAPHEFNSPVYGAHHLSPLAVLRQLTSDPLIRLQARLLYERLWLHYGLHLHRPTGQIAGPHCRCYWEPMLSGQGPLKDILWRETGWGWALQPGPDGERSATEVPASIEQGLADHKLPSYVAVWLQQQEQAMPYEVRETADAAKGYDLASYFTHSYALGTASRTYAIGTDCFYIEHQANYLILYYRRPQQPDGWGMMYSRYVVNDQHWGTMGAAPDRPKTLNFYDQGHFAGVQLCNKAIGLYALMPQHTEVFSLKMVVAFQSGDALEEVLVDDQAIELASLPYPLDAGRWVVVADGAVYVGVRPLEPSCLGREAPSLLERGPLGELWLTIYNYRGAAKRFWDYASLSGAFWQGNIRAGFVVEVAERSEYPSVQAFLAHLRKATIEDAVDGELVRTVTFRSGGDEISLRYDLWNTKPRERLLNGVLYKPPSLESPLAVQGDTGELRVGQAKLVTNPQPIWLVAQELEPAQRVWLAVNPEDCSTPLRLETPRGVITADAWGLGQLEWRAPVRGEQALVIESLREPEGLQVPEGVRVLRRSP